MSMILGLPAPDTTTSETAQASVPVTSNGYIVLPVTIDPNQLTADAFGFIQLQIPGWLPYEGQLEAWLIEACAQMVSTYAQVAAQVPLQIFEYLGGQLFNLPPQLGTPSQAPTTWTMVDNKGYIVPAGTQVAFQTNGNTYVLFETTADFTVPTGSTATTSGAVTVQAVNVGAANNAIPAGPLLPADSLSYVSSVVSTEATSGGTDAETTAAYVSRLSNRLTLITPRPVLAPDFALLSVGQQGCARALGIDNFNAAANMLTPPDDGTGTPGVGSWTGISNATVTQVVTPLQASTTSTIKVTPGGAGACVAATNNALYPVSPGSTYAAVIGVEAATSTVSIAAIIRWKNAAGTVLSTSTGTGSVDSTSSFGTRTASDVAPANAATAEIGVSYTAAGSSDIHYLGQRALFFVPSGTSTPAWSAGGLLSGQERMVTVVPVDVNGDALSPTAMAAIDTYLDTLREVNFDVTVAPPTFFNVAVVASVLSNYGTDPNAVQSLISSALTAYFSQANWAGGLETPPVWLNDPQIRYLSVAGLIENIAGVHHISSLTLNGGTSDITMTGYAPLPVATVSVTVSVAAANT